MKGDLKTASSKKIEVCLNKSELEESGLYTTLKIFNSMYY